MSEPAAKPRTWPELALEISNEHALTKAVRLASELLQAMDKEDREKRTGLAKSEAA